ncbi:MAG: DUF3800 domain-containing protein [Myxococcota bacterium]|nr:DUF3800 domain-containing protein [Myxococcota bacterium]
MSHLLFLDESGVDHRDSPYEVLAGVAIGDRELWNLICQVQEAEQEHFGTRISEGLAELKARKLLKGKTFRLAAQLDPLPPDERARLARSCLEKGSQSKEQGSPEAVTRAELTALAQAKVAFVERVLELCARYRVRAFASIVPCSAPRPTGDFLRKDYAYLFERFYYFLDEQPGSELGLVVFDELKKSQAHMLVGQMAKYFRETAKGKQRAGRVIPEPFFVHSDLTTAIQLADLVAYIIAWGFRFSGMTAPARPELAGLAQQVSLLRHRSVRPMLGLEDFAVWSFTLIDDLRPREEQRSR